MSDCYCNRQPCVCPEELKMTIGDTLNAIEEGAVAGLDLDAVLKTQVQPQPPFLFMDLYPYDFDDPKTTALDDPPWNDLLKDDRIRGVILKATDGLRTNYAGKFTDWYIRNMRLQSPVFTRLRGGYHYLQFFQDPTLQADFHCAILKQGGWERNGKWIRPIVDVEDGGERAANRKASAQQIIDCCGKFAGRVQTILGCCPILYGRGALRDRAITQAIPGVDGVWNPSYTRTMHMAGLEPYGLKKVRLWQYCGDGVGDNEITKLPLYAGNHKVDLSVAVNGADPVTWQSVLESLT